MDDMRNTAVTHDNLGEYKIFEDERRFQPRGLRHPEGRLARNGSNDNEPDPNIYTLADGTQFWFDGVLNRVVTKEPDFYIQFVLDWGKERSESRLFVSIDGRRIQLSKKNNGTFEFLLPKDEFGRMIWLIEEIGSPLLFITAGRDLEYGIRRPWQEQRQCLTNAERFASVDQQNRAIEFVKTALSAYGNAFSGHPAFGRDLPGTVVFSDDLKQQLDAGDLIEG